MILRGHLDLNQNHIINVILDPRATAPATGVQGQVYFNTGNNRIYKHDGSTWVDIAGLTDIISENGSLNVEIADGIANIDINVDNASIEIASTGEVRIKDSGVTTSKLTDSAVTTLKVTDKAITFAKIQDIPTMTVIGRVTSGIGPSSSITIINDDNLTGADDTNLATAGSIKAYIDASISSIGTLQGGLNASTATNFPGTSDTVSGDYWRVTNAGTIQGITLQVGDIVMASIANPSPTDPNDWVFFEGNRDQATTTVMGMVMLSTDAETQTGTNASKAVTPKSLSSRTATETRTGLARISTTAEAISATDNTTIMTPSKVKALLDANIGGYTALLPSNTSVIVTHGLGTQYLVAEFYLESTKERILCDYFATSATTVTVTFPTAPTANEIRIVIKK